MNFRLFAYVRVSTRDQNEDRQLIAMREFGVPEAGIVIEKMSGKDFKRPAYQKLLSKLRRGDTLVVMTSFCVHRSTDGTRWHKKIL